MPLVSLSSQHAIGSYSNQNSQPITQNGHILGPYIHTIATRINLCLLIYIPYARIATYAIVGVPTHLLASGCGFSNTVTPNGGSRIFVQAWQKF